MIRRTTLNLNYTNKGKSEVLYSVAEEYRLICQNGCICEPYGARMHDLYKMPKPVRATVVKGGLKDG